MGKHFRLFLWAITSVLIFGLHPQETVAVATPNAADVFVMPGESVTVSVPVVNEQSGDRTIDFSLFVAEFSENQEAPTFRRPTAEEAAWVQMNMSHVSLAQDEMRTVDVTVSAPKNAAAGVVPFALVASDRVTGPVTLSYGAATLIFVTVGYPQYAGSCDALLRVSDDRAQMHVKNDGRGILVPNGVSQLRGPLGIVFAERELDVRDDRVLPGQEKEWTIPIPSAPWWAFGTLVLHVNDEAFYESPCAPIVVSRAFVLPLGIGVVVLGIGTMLFLRRR